MAAITAELIDGYRVDITDGTHIWRADEPVDLGGDDTGPNPYDLLLGALAACTVITLSMYARRKGIEMTSLSVEYRHDRIHSDDCDRCDERKDGMLDRIASRIFIDGDFDEATRERLISVAQRCPVHKTLEQGVVFDESVYAG
jgi:putative redox protein